jgi:hypothetical protein
MRVSFRTRFLLLPRLVLPRLVLLRLVACLVLVAPAAGAAGEVRRVEAVGAVALEGAAVSTPNPRDAAMQAGLSEAVRQVAMALLGGLEPMPDDEPGGASGKDPRDDGVESILAGALGDDPLVYVNGYRTVEDRGERPALFVADPGAETEYVVVVEAQVSVERVRNRLVEGGLLAEAPAGQGERLSLRVSVDGLESHGAYLEVIDALRNEGGARSAKLVEASSGRMVFEVEADHGGPRMLAGLVQASRPGLRITPLLSQDHHLAFRVEWEPSTPAERALEDASLD